jgi:hypothetical protein
MRAMLKSHPVTPPGAVESIEAEAVRGGSGGLRLRFVARGDMAVLAVPEAAAAARMDGLWRTTCFEAFVCAEGEAAYIELNLSPSGEWQAYGFDGYRSGMGEADIAPPHIEVERGPDRLELRAEIEVPTGGDWRLGLSAVIEAADGSVSYWALAHPPGRPDFHHADCFAAVLKADERS